MRNACDLNGNSHANTRCTNEDYWRLIKIPLPILTQKYVKFPNHNVTINQFCYIYLWQTSTIFMFGFGTHELSPFDFRHRTRNSSQNYALHAKGLCKANITKSTKSIIILLLITLLSSCIYLSKSAHKLNPSGIVPAHLNLLHRGHRGKCFHDRQPHTLTLTTFLTIVPVFRKVRFISLVDWSIASLKCLQKSSSK